MHFDLEGQGWGMKLCIFIKLLAVGVGVGGVGWEAVQGPQFGNRKSRASWNPLVMFSVMLVTRRPVSLALCMPVPSAVCRLAKPSLLPKRVCSELCPAPLCLALSCLFYSLLLVRLSSVRAPNSVPPAPSCEYNAPRALPHAQLTPKCQP